MFECQKACFLPPHLWDQEPRTSPSPSHAITVMAQPPYPMVQMGLTWPPHQLVPVCLTPNSHKPSSFLVLLPRMGRAGSSSSSVPSSSPSLSLSEERAGPEGGTTGARCLSPRKERSQKRRLTGQETNNDGLVCEKEALGLQELLLNSTCNMRRYKGSHTVWTTVSTAISGPLTVWLQKPFGERLVLVA